MTSNGSQVLVSSEITGLSTLGALARDSIEVGKMILQHCTSSNQIQFSMMDEDQKRYAFMNWEKRWKVFIDNILTPC
jgi:adenosine deaminase CECR1